MKVFTPGKVISVLLLAGLAYGAWWWQQQKSVDTAKPKYRTSAVDRGSIVQRIAANGTLNPVTVVNIGTQISGTVIRLHADFNSRVKKNQVLAELDPSLLKAQIEQTEATMKSMMATWQLARSTLERNQSLRDKGFISDSALDTARKDLDSSAAQIVALKAQISRDRTNLSYSVIRSPIDGIVVDRTVDVGQTVAASFQTPTLFKIARDLTAMQIDTSVSEADIGAIKPGMPVAFTVDAFREREFGGIVRIVRLNPTMQQNVVTYNVVIDVKNDSGVLLPGMTAQVAIVTQRRDDVLRIPNAALRFRPSDAAQAPKAAGTTGEKVADKGGAKGGGAIAGGAAAGGSIAMGATSMAGGRTAARGPATAARPGRVYKLSADGDAVPVEVRTGISDIRATEAIGDGLVDGDQVIVREQAPERPPGQGLPGFRMRFF